MRRHLQQAHDCWLQHDVVNALVYYHRALHSRALSAHDKKAAHYMSAYLNCLLARREHQEQAFLGFDLRHSYHDYYIDAARHLIKLGDVNFSGREFDLPEIDPIVLREVWESWHYYHELHEAFVFSWRIRIKALWRYFSGHWLHKPLHQ